MTATAMVGNYQDDFNTLATANQLRAASEDFTQLPWNRSDGIGYIDLSAGQAVYLYGGRDALLDALNQLRDERRVKAVGNQPLAVFRASRPVAGGLKTKQLLMITPLPGNMSDKLQKMRVTLTLSSPVMSIRVFELKQLIMSLSK